MMTLRTLLIPFLLAGMRVQPCSARAARPAEPTPAGWTVSSPEDGGPGSLREAVALAGPGQIIGFAAALSGGRLLLTNGPLVIDRSMTITAADLPRGITLSGGGEHRVVLVHGNGTNDTVVLDSLTLSDGFERQGAGLLQQGGHLIVRGCLFVNNQATARLGGGGGLAVVGGVLEVENCTFTQNSTPGRGAALLLRGRDHRLSHVTVVRNLANSWEEGHGNVHAAGPLRVDNSILGRNGGPDLTREPGTTVVLRHTLIGQDPGLAPLGDYGGPTRSMPPKAGSLAIDAGRLDPGQSPPRRDQRGRTREVDGDGNGIPEPDLGAVEMQGSTLVTTLQDGGPGSLRESLMFATRGSTVRFAPELSGGTIPLTQGPLEIAESLTIDASGLPRGLLLTARGRSRVLWIRRIHREVHVTLDSLTIAGGTSLGGSGLLSEEASVVIRRCLFRDNHASGRNGDGGAIQTSGGSLVVENTTFTRNSAMDAGGALFLLGSRHQLRHVTIVGNDAGGSGDGIYLVGNLLLLDSIVAGNDRENVGWGSFPALTEANSLRDGDPQLEPLGDYGGPTETMPPRRGSPAVDAARPRTSAATAETDQRGHLRAQDGNHDGLKYPDIGAVELDATVAPGPRSQADRDPIP